MIVDSMTFDDVFRKFQADIPLLNHKIEEGNKYYSRLSRNSRNKNRVYYNPIRFKSQRGFLYVIQFFCRGNNEPEKDKLGIFYYVMYIQNRGMHVFRSSQMNRTEWHVTHFIPHFFDRYRERYCKDLSVDKKDVIHQFFINNLRGVSQKKVIPSKKHPNEFWMAYPEGLCLCENPMGTFVRAKTFVSWDMARIDQKQFVLEGLRALQDYDFELNLPVEDFEEYEFISNDE